MKEDEKTDSTNAGAQQEQKKTNAVEENNAAGIICKLMNALIRVHFMYYISIVKQFTFHELLLAVLINFNISGEIPTTEAVQETTTFSSEADDANDVPSDRHET